MDDASACLILCVRASGLNFVTPLCLSINGRQMVVMNVFCLLCFLKMEGGLLRQKVTITKRGWSVCWRVKEWELERAYLWPSGGSGTRAQTITRLALSCCVVCSRLLGCEP